MENGTECWKSLNQRGVLEANMLIGLLHQAKKELSGIKILQK